jgi:hypothetical protein
MKTLLHNGIGIHYRDEGHGMPFAFQIDLGGGLNQSFGPFLARQFREAR